MAFPLNSLFRAGSPLAGLTASWLNTVANILNDIRGVGCHIEKPGGGEGLGWTIVVDSAPSMPDGVYKGDILYWVEAVGGDPAQWKVLTRPTATKVLTFDTTDKLHWDDPPPTMPDGVYKGDILYWVEAVGQTAAHWAVLTRPTGPALLAFDGTSNIHWAALGTDYMTAVRKVDDSVTGDWIRAH